jgi:hypothetical protein
MKSSHRLEVSTWSEASRPLDLPLAQGIAIEDVTLNGKDGLPDAEAAQSDGATPECTTHPAHTKAAFWIVQDPDPSAAIRCLDVVSIE